MRDITPEHLAFVDDAAHVFEDNPRRETHWNENQTLVAFRFGLDRDCVMVYELGDYIGNFVQQVDKRFPSLRKQVYGFAHEMERQLQANEHRGGWENSSYEYLMSELSKHFEKLSKCNSHSEFRRRCANIANYAMMLADNDRREEDGRK